MISFCLLMTYLHEVSWSLGSLSVRSPCKSKLQVFQIAQCSNHSYNDYSLLPRSQFCDLSAGCNRDSWRGSVEVVFWNIMLLVSFRKFQHLSCCRHLAGYSREGKDSKEHYLICGVQGDFTKGLVDDPPTHIWTRELKVRRHASSFWPRLMTTYYYF